MHTHGEGGCDNEVESAVLAYLDRHPHAADTLDGITDWWLPRQRYITARNRIEAVLSRLVEAGVLRLRRLPNGAVLYTLDADRRGSPDGVDRH